MNPEVSRWTIGCLESLGRSLMAGDSFSACRAKFSDVLDKVPWLDGPGRADVASRLESTMRALKRMPADALPAMLSSPKFFDPTMRAFNRAQRRMWLRTKQTSVKSGMKICREMEIPVIFYLVSSHQKPQPAHKDLQGKILIDRYWRDTLRQSGLENEIPRIERYVKANGTLSVQSSMQDPYYLIVRPHCKHRLFPLRTSEVLSWTPRQIWERHREARTGESRSKTTHQLWVEYMDARAKLFGKLSYKH